MQKLGLKNAISRLLVMSVILLFNTGGCVTQQVIHNRVTIAKGIQMELMSPQSFSQNITMTQLAHFILANDEHELLFQTEITEEKIVIVGLMPSGTRLFSLVYDGDKIVSEGYSELIEKINPRYLLADMQLAIWPIETLSRHLKVTSSCFRDKDCTIVQSSNGLGRSLLSSGEELISVEYQNKILYQGKLNYHHKVRAYQIELTTLDIAVLNTKSE